MSKSSYLEKISRHPLSKTHLPAGEILSRVRINPTRSTEKTYLSTKYGVLNSYTADETFRKFIENDTYERDGKRYFECMFSLHGRECGSVELPVDAFAQDADLTKKVRLGMLENSDKTAEVPVVILWLEKSHAEALKLHMRKQVAQDASWRDKLGGRLNEANGNARRSLQDSKRVTDLLFHVYESNDVAERLSEKLQHALENAATDRKPAVNAMNTKLPVQDFYLHNQQLMVTGEALKALAAVLEIHDLAAVKTAGPIGRPRS
jgi:hypothetical protein